MLTTVYCHIQFQYANFCDILMMIIGAIMAMFAGLGLPIHIILAGTILNQFVYHDIVTSNNLQIPLSVNESCELYRSERNLLSLMNNLTTTPGSTSYFCSNSSSGSDITSNLLEYVCDPDSTLRIQIGLYSIYYVALATSILFAAFLSTTLWNLSAHRQVQKMRKALYQSIIHQDIGWFDGVETGDITTRLVE